MLVFRFSALGDVAMTVPVLRLLLQQYPALEVTFVSDPFMEPLFDGIERLHFVGADTKREYKGIVGLYRLSQQLKKLQRFEAVADLHNVLRSRIVGLFITGVKSAAIDKGRAEKKELTRPVNKKLRQLKTGFQRYADVFAKLGYSVELGNEIILPGTEIKKNIVGVAPFARHLPKMYPLDKMKEVVRLLAADGRYQVMLFGSKGEAEVLETWTADNVTSVAGKVSFREELAMIKDLKCMISMDSANMHLASMFDVPVISVWGGTHPYLGFYGWRQDMKNAVQMDLPCRPSSVFGNKPCPVHGDQGCMDGITPEEIVERVVGPSFHSG